MDTFEDMDQNTRGNVSGEMQNNETAQQPKQSQPYRGAGVGQKESPYADSPYMTDVPRQNSGCYTQPNYQPNYGQSAPNYQADQRQNYQTGYQQTYQPNYQANPPKPPKARKVKKQAPGNGWRRVLAAVLVVAVVAAGCLVTGITVNNKWSESNAELQQQISDLTEQVEALGGKVSSSSDSSGNSVSGSPVSSGDTLTPSQVYAQNVDSVVTVSCTVQSYTYGQVSTGTSSGSGFIITSDGYIVTNYHVIEDSSAITITTHDGTEYTATVKGSDSTNDVAVLKVEAENLQAVTLGSSDELNIGDMVVAIGNPLGTLSATQTVGYVSGTNREVTTDNTVINMIQTDAVINPGNSGGPLFNMKGEVVGITTAKYSGTTSSGASIEGIGFAIPIDDVQGIIGDLQNLGYVTGAYLGITVQDVDSDSASRYGLPSGAYVVSVVSGGAADQAGVKAKDIITGLGDTTITSMTTLTRALRDYKAGDTTTLTVVRSGQALTLTVTLDERPQDLNSTDDSSSAETDPNMPDEGNYSEWYDFFRRYFGNGSNGNNG